MEIRGGVGFNMIQRALYQSVVAVAFVVALIVSPASAEEKRPAQTAARPAPPTSEISSWIAELNDDRYVVRERATRQLTEAGAAALDALAAAVDADRPEPAERAVWIMRRLSTDKDPALKRKTLEHLAGLKKRPQIAAAARATLKELEHDEAVAAFEELGASYGPDELAIQMGAGSVFK